MSLFAARAGGLTAERAKVLEARTGIRDALLGCVGSVVQLSGFGEYRSWEPKAKLSRFRAIRTLGQEVEPLLFCRVVLYF